mgnify:CR=1 FL=1
MTNYQSAKAGADVGDDRNERVAQGVQTDGATLGQPLGDGRAQVVGAQVLDQARAHQAGHVGQGE